MKKFLSVFLSCALLLACLPLFSFQTGAEEPKETCRIQVSSVDGAKGSTVSVTVDLTHNVGVSALQLQLEYDPEMLTLVGAEDGGLFPESALSPDYDSPYVMAWIDTNAESNTETGTLCTLSFSLSSELTTGEEIPVSVTCLEAFDTDYNAVDFVCESGTVTVGDLARGNLDGRGGINADDAIYLLYHTVFATRYPLPEGMDVDFDKNGSVEAADAIYLLYYTVFPDRYPI